MCASPPINALIGNSRVAHNIVCGFAHREFELNLNSLNLPVLTLYRATRLATFNCDTLLPYVESHAGIKFHIKLEFIAVEKVDLNYAITC
jgi:hypothetical protein